MVEERMRPNYPKWTVQCLFSPKVLKVVPSFQKQTSVLHSILDFITMQHLSFGKLSNHISEVSFHLSESVNGEFYCLCQFCLLVCSICTFFTVLGSYIPGVVLSYVLCKYGLFQS